MKSEEEFNNGKIKIKKWPKFILEAIYKNKKLNNIHNNDNKKKDNIQNLTNIKNLKTQFKKQVNKYKIK